MKGISVILLWFFTLSLHAQSSRVSTIDFVQVVDDNEEEALFYYQNNWLVLRRMAVERDYIASFEIISVESSVDAPFDIMLITTYADFNAFQKAEENFGILIKERGDIRLLNEKKPGEFRKVIFSKIDGRHLD